MNPVLYAAANGVTFNLSLGLVFVLVLVFGFGSAVAGIFFRDRRAQALLALAIATGSFLIFVMGVALGATEALLLTGMGLLALVGLAIVKWTQEQESAIPQKATHPCPECGTILADDTPEGLCPRCLLHSGLGSAFPSPPESDAHTGAYRGPFVPPMPADLARFFPQIEILELLGQGGMGAVYKARQVKLDRLVALKILPPEWGKDPAFAERFMREARALAKLSHPHIVAVHDFGEAEGLYYFVMEYVDGPNLRQVLHNGQLPPDEALRVVPQLCEALQYAHEEGIVHRDIKPENILLDRKGRVKVADFGLAKLVGPTPGHFTLTGSRQVVGTPHYMAPEQMEKPLTVDHRADIYSLGVVLYEMLTGELPLGRFAPPSQKAAVDARLDEVVLRALAKEPAERYQRISEVKANLESVFAGQTPAPLPFSGPALRAVSLPFHSWGASFHTSVFGLARYDGQALTLEMEVQEADQGLLHLNFKEKKYQEKRIPIECIESIRFEKTWLGPVIAVQVSRLSLVADLPNSRQGQIRLYVAKKDREMAVNFTAQVARRLDGGMGSRVSEAFEVRTTPEEDILRPKVTGPAIGLLITALLGAINWIVLGVAFFKDWSRYFGNLADVLYVYFLVGLGVMVPVVILLTGSAKLRNLKGYPACIIASIVAMLPWSYAFLIGLPVGIWTLWVLRRPEIQMVFRRRENGEGEVVPPTGFLRRKLHSLARAARFWVVDSSDSRKDQHWLEEPPAETKNSKRDESP